MPRNHNPGPSTLRNRNRVTNKTRLRVITESIDADPIVLDEDEEKARVVSTAGVDAEDANEHHLQAVLSAAATRHQAGTRSTRGAAEKEKTTPAAYIPTPDSTGLVDNYEELYPTCRWKDPITYLKFSDTVEESVSYALLNGHIYYMDERDEEWLNKNNEEARGEGTSAQGALPATGTRSARSAKGKGKEPELGGTVAMMEDEFELVMAIFEKVTHEKTEFLHHGLSTGAPFPPFGDYEDTFANDLRPDMFALFNKPDWVPEPSTLLRFARVVYPHWRERREERQGHRIISTVNLDETDTLNESYVCFRRRELKAIRKTRAQQATYSDKMLRLGGELEVAKVLSESVIERERLKRVQAHEHRAVWEKRLALVDLKRKYPVLGAKEDEELYHDKERVPKKPKLETNSGRLKFRAKENGDTGSPITVPEPTIKPKERFLQIRNQVDLELAKIKEKDRAWEDVVDNPSQPSPAAHASRLYKFIAATRASSVKAGASSEDEETTPRPFHAARLRFGRGGRMHLDRRMVFGRAGRPAMLSDSEEDDSETSDLVRRIAERWKFDSDDDPAVGPEGPDEQDRILYDEYQPKHMAHHMCLLTEQDYLQTLAVDTTVTVNTAEGRHEATPFRIPQPQLQSTPTRRDMPPGARPPSMIPGQPIASMHHANGVAGSPSASVNGTAMPVATQMKKMPPPTALPHMRISSNGGIRLPAASPVPNIHSNVPPPLASPPGSSGQSHGTQDAHGSTADGTEHDIKVVPNGTVPSSPAVVDAVPASMTSPIRAKAQIQPLPMPAVPNGYHVPAVNGYPANITNAHQYMQARPNAFTVQQMHNLKSAFATMTPSPDSTMRNGAQQMYMGGPGLNSAQLRHWASMVANQQQQQQRPPSISAVDVGAVDAAAALSPQMQGAPARVPSANGMRTASMGRTPGVPNVALNGQGRVSPTNVQIARLTAPLSPSPLLISPSLSAAQSSPTRAPPPLAAPSPSLQSRQIGAGY